jgi:hypothetical protein
MDCFAALAMTNAKRVSNPCGGAMANIVARYLSFEGRLARLPFFGRGVFLGVIAAAVGMATIPFSRAKACGGGSASLS